MFVAMLPFSLLIHLPAYTGFQITTVLFSDIQGLALSYLFSLKQPLGKLPKTSLMLKPL
jgi:hypothetical protein